MTQSRRYGNSKGFTLAEVLVVLIILGIAATIVIPMIGDTSGMRVTSAVRHISSTLMFAQTAAISAQQPVQVIFDADAESYDLGIAAGRGLTRLDFNDRNKRRFNRPHFGGVFLRVPFDWRT